MLTEEDIEKIAEKVLRKLVINGAEYAPLTHMHAATQMMVDDVLWYHRVGNVAHIDKVKLTGPPSQYQPNPAAQGAGNRVTFTAYTFTQDGEERREVPVDHAPPWGGPLQL